MRKILIVAAVALLAGCSQRFSMSIGPERPKDAEWMAAMEAAVVKLDRWSEGFAKAADERFKKLEPQAEAQAETPEAE